MTTTERTTVEDFPVSWSSPELIELTWRFEVEHTPDVVTPLSFDLYFGPFIDGFGWARATLQNYYVFVWYQETAFSNATANLDTGKLTAAGKYFWDSVVPEAEGYTQRFLRTDFDALSDDDLLAEMELLPSLRMRMGHLHTLSLFPHGAGMDYLINTYRELVDDDPLAAVGLMHGFGNKSVEAGRALWALSRQAATIPAVRDGVAGVSRDNAIDCMAALRADGSAREFVAAFESFLDDYGWRADLFELAQATWAENPTIPLCQMRKYLEMPESDPNEEQRQLVAGREAARAETFAKLSARDAEKLRDVLEMARHVVSLQEDHNFYIDQRCAYSARRPILAAARRLVSKNRLSAPDDVFYLTGTELLSAMRGHLSDAQFVADERKSEMARWSSVEPPRWIGATPTDDGSKAPVLREAWVGARNEPASSALELTGNGASPGIARGPARVLMSLAEADRFQPGDVLVARTTMPAWTPLFYPAAAIITETGGMLSHAAVTAREYATPAVLNVAEATRKIRDGQLVEVDGTRGIVRILP